jgi:hypothetical protein
MAEINFSLCHGRTCTNVPVPDESCWYFDVWDSEKALAYGLVLEGSTVSQLLAGYQVVASNGSRHTVRLRLTPVRPQEDPDRAWTLDIKRNGWSLSLVLSVQNFVDLIKGKTVEVETESKAA